MIFRRRHEGLRWVSGMVLALMLSALLTGCAKRSVSRATGSATLPSSLEGTTTGGGSAASTLPPIDPVVVLEEIQRRQGAIDLARERYDRLGAGTEKEAMGAWIQALEGQMTILGEIHSTLETWPATESAADQAVMTRDLAGRLVACLAMAPMETSRPALSPYARDATLTWESMRTAYERGNCVEVLEQYDAYAVAAHESTVPVEVEVIRALCLSRTGKYGEAAQVLEPLLKARAQLLDTQYLHYLLANWLFEESLLEQAGEAYRSVVDGARERDQWAELATLRMNQIRLQRGEPLSPEPDQALTGSGTEPIMAGIPAADAASVDEMQSRTSNSEQGVTWEPKMQPTRPAGDPSVASIHQLRDAKLQEGKQFVDNEQYEEAVIAYQTLLGTEYDTMAREGIQLAKDLYAEKYRREAASLVLKAHGDADMASRKALLVQALRMLQDINVRYPGNKYAAKVQQNIKDVVEQIQGIDPAFDPHGPATLMKGGDPQARVFYQ